MVQSLNILSAVWPLSVIPHPNASPQPKLVWECPFCALLTTQNLQCLSYTGMAPPHSLL